MIRLSRGRIILAALVFSAMIMALPAVVSRRVRLAAADLFEPITSAANDLLGGLRLRLREFGRGGDLSEELGEERRRRRLLETELARTRDKLHRLQRVDDERAGLQEVMSRVDVRRSVPVAANVIRRPGRWESRELVVDRGAASGVGTRDAVLVGDVALGVVVEARGETSRVLAMGHPGLVIPARIVQTRQQGMVEASAGKLKLRYITRDRPVKPGDTVVTSGQGGVFPPGCLIGTVARGVGPAGGQPFYDITVEIPFGTSNPEVVWILVQAPEAEKK